MRCATHKFDQITAIPGLNAAVTWHKFGSDLGGTDFGHEWNASLGFRISRVAVLAKYAAYSARGFGVNTKKFWLQAEAAF